MGDGWDGFVRGGRCGARAEGERNGRYMWWAVWEQLSAFSRQLSAREEEGESITAEGAEAAEKKQEE